MAVSLLSCVCGKFVIPQRYILCLMTFLGILMSYTTRVDLHMVISTMVKQKNESVKHSYCRGDIQKRSAHLNTMYNWTKQQEGMVLAGFFPGYVLTHIPGGVLADVFGGKHVLSSGVAISALFTILTPITVKYGSWWALTISRFIIGLAQGPLFPSTTALMARWVPKRERGTLVSLVSTGAQVGTIAGNLLSSILVEYYGWVIVFYFWGILAIIWYILFFALCYSEPAQHPFITAEEAIMLEEEIGIQQKLQIPWVKILTDVPVWAMILAEVGHDWLFFLAVVEIPTYINTVLGLDMQSNGIMNSIPYLALTISCTVSGIIADVVINTNKISILNTRKLFTLIGNVIPAICIMLIPYMECQTVHVGVMFVMCMLTMGPFYAGMRVNALDITTNFSGVVMGIVNGIGAVAFSPIPYIIAVVTPNGTPAEWKIVFWALLLAIVVVTIGYIIWASSERATWDKNALATSTAPAEE